MVQVNIIIAPNPTGQRSLMTFPEFTEERKILRIYSSSEQLIKEYTFRNVKSIELNAANMQMESIILKLSRKRDC